MMFFSVVFGVLNVPPQIGEAQYFTDIEEARNMDIGTTYEAFSHSHCYRHSFRRSREEYQITLQAWLS